jgi:hypothetical protein
VEIVTPVSVEFLVARPSGVVVDSEARLGEDDLIAVEVLLESQKFATIREKLRESQDFVTSVI